MVATSQAPKKGEKKRAHVDRDMLPISIRSTFVTTELLRAKRCGCVPLSSALLTCSFSVVDRGWADLDGGRTAVLRKASSTEVWSVGQSPVTRLCSFGPCDTVVASGVLVVVATRGWLEVYDMSALGWAALEKAPLLAAVCGVKSVKKRNDSVERRGRSGSGSSAAVDVAAIEGSAALIENATAFGGYFFCIFEGCCYSLPMSAAALSAFGPRKELAPHGAMPWSTSGTVTCLAFHGDLGYSGHTSGHVTSWNLATGEVVRLYEAHNGTVTAVLPQQDRLFSAGSDNVVRQFRTDNGQEFRSWSMEFVAFAEMRIEGSFLMACSRLSLIFIDLSSSENAVACKLFCERKILDWKCDSGSEKTYAHLLTEDGSVSSFSLPKADFVSPYLPDVRVAPEHVWRFGSDLRCGSFLIGPRVTALTMTMDGRGFKCALKRPLEGIFLPASGAIVKLQARIRQRRVARALQANTFNVDQARQMRFALRQAASIEFSQADRLEFVASHRVTIVETMPAAGRSFMMVCVSIAQAHSELGKKLAIASQTWPPPGLTAIVPAYAAFFARIASLSDVFVLFAEHVPALVPKLGQRGGVWGPIFLHYGAAQTALLNLCRVQRLVPMESVLMFRLATQMETVLADVKRRVLRNSFACDTQAWERPLRRLVIGCEGEWQGVLACRVLLCDDALLVVSPNKYDKKLFSKLPSSVKKGAQLFELFPLVTVSAVVDAAKPHQIIVTAGANKFKFAPQSPVSVELWLEQLRVVREEGRISHYGMDLQRVLFEEDTNIPLAVSSICQVARQRGNSFADMWLDLASQRADAPAATSPPALLEMIWRGNVAFSACSDREMLRALHYYLRGFPDAFVPVLACKEMSEARSNPRQLDSIVSRLAPPVQILIGYILGFAMDLLAMSFADDPEHDRKLFAHGFARELIGGSRAVTARTDWIKSADYAMEVDALEALLTHFPAIWRSRLVPEKCVGEWKQKKERSDSAAGSSLPRRSLHRSSVGAKWSDSSETEVPAALVSVAGALVVMDSKPKGNLSGVFRMDSSREPSGDVSDVAFVSIVYNGVEKHYPAVPASKLLAMFLSEPSVNDGSLIAFQNTSLVNHQSSGVPVPIAPDAIPRAGSRLRLVVSPGVEPKGRSPRTLSPPTSPPRSGPSPDPAIVSDNSNSPPTGGSGSSPSPSPSASTPAPAIKNVPLRRGLRGRAVTGVDLTLQHRRSRSMDSADLAAAALAVGEVPALGKPPEEDSPERVRDPAAKPISTSGGGVPQLMLQSKLPLHGSSSAAALTERSARASGSAARSVLHPLHKNAVGKVQSATDLRSNSISKLHSGVLPSPPEARPNVSVTMTVTTTVVSASPKVSIMQRLIGKKKSPPASVSDSPTAMKRSVERKVAEAPVMWNNVKLVVVGQENVGKTHLCRQLENAKYDVNMSTDGVEIGTWNSGKGKNQVSFATFDFGGQEIFYPTHQFFLTSRCAYIIAFRVNKPDFMERVMYWIRTIDASIPYAAAPPIVLVGTHRDDPAVTEQTLASVKSELEKVARRFRMVKDIVFVSCTRGTGIAHLRSVVMQVAVSARLALEPVPKYYVDLYEAVHQASLESPFCSFSDYREMAQRCDVPMDGAFNVVTKFLHDVGRLIYFGTAEQQNSQTVVLNAGWLAARMADLISFKQNWPSGVVDMARLSIVWKQYDQEQRDEILALLERFQVVFFKRSRQKGPGTAFAPRFGQGPQEVVVPCLLPEAIDLSVVSQGLKPELNTLLRKRVYVFKWIPLGFSARLVSLFHSHKEFRVTDLWRHGLLLTSAVSAKHRGMIECQSNYKENTFRLVVTTTAADQEDAVLHHSPVIGAVQRKTLIHEMVSVVDALMRDFCSHSPVEREVMCSSCMKTRPEVAPGGFRFEVLVQLFTSNKTRAACGVCYELVPIALLAPDITFSFLPVVESLTLGPLIGRGGFGLVYRGTLKDGTEVAVKEMLVAGDDEAVVEKFRQFQHEVCMMSLVSHPNLVRMFGVQVQPKPRIVMEFCPLPDLSQILYGKGQDKRLLTYSQKLAIAFDVASALAYLHGQSSPVVHRDVRSPNVFIVSLNLQQGVVAKLGDYGLAATVVAKLTESLPTFQWLAPEILTGAQYDESVDVYSLAMVMLELIANKLPFCEFHNYFTTFTQWTTFYCRLCGDNEVCRQTDECRENQVEKVETGEKLIWKEQQVKVSEIIYAIVLFFVNLSP